jgi:hypothetical protein
MSTKKDYPHRNLPLSEKLRRKDSLILRLSVANKRLKLRIANLEKTVEKLKQPSLYKRLLAFMKKLFQLK